MPDETNMELVRLITEDLNKHREYVQKLYTRAFIAGGVIVGTVLAIGVWFLSDRVNNELIHYILVKDVKNIVTPLAKAEAAKAYSQFARDDIEEVYAGISRNIWREAYSSLEDSVAVEIQDALAQKLEEIRAHEVRSFLEDYVDVGVPSGAVLAFRSIKCPAGWMEYGLAKGRFILGTSHSYPLLTTGGEKHVTLPVSKIPSHSHMVEAVTNLSSTESDTYEVTTEPEKQWGSVDTVLSGGDETLNSMPPYIALTLCLKSDS